MSGTVRTFATMAVGGVLGLALGFAVTLSVAPAVVRDTPPVVSNAAAKQDRLDPAPSARPARAPGLAAASRIESEGVAGLIVTLRDRDGRVLYRHDPDRRETTVARDSAIEGPAGAAGSPGIPPGDAIRMAKADPEGFLARTLGTR